LASTLAPANAIALSASVKATAITKTFFIRILSFPEPVSGFDFKPQPVLVQLQFVEGS
jgi:hypothetical protein